MTARTLALSGGRNLIITSLDEPVGYLIRRPLAVLMPAFDAGESRKVESIAGAFVDLGCVEFCCVGPHAEQLHDSLDVLIEARGDIEIVTTWHTDSADACEYFLFAAGGAKLPTLLALVSAHPALAARLADEAKIA